MNTENDVKEFGFRHILINTVYNVILSADLAVIFPKYITLRTNIKKVRHTTNGALHFFRQIGQDLTFIA